MIGHHHLQCRLSNAGSADVAMDGWLLLAGTAVALAGRHSEHGGLLLACRAKPVSHLLERALRCRCRMISPAQAYLPD